MNPNDIIHLNVGGQRLSTKRSTLCRVEGSLLASMFSGRWNHEHDHDGAVFLDYNPEFFVPIINYLRAMEYATTGNPPSFPQLREDQIKDFQRFIQYLGLSGEIFSREKFNAHSINVVTLQEGGTVAVHGPNGGHMGYVLGENVYQQGIVHFKLKLESFQVNEWMFVGTVKAYLVPPNNNSHQWPDSYGWVLGQYGQVWKDGSPTYDALKNLTKQGDTVELVLDCDAAKLSLHLPTGQQFHIEIPKSQTWRLNVNLGCANDKVRIIHDNV
ncbi:SHKBP1 isoform 5 [Paramuricea clavata]|uniref:SHKBP1 isoform 5 n=1 Tax=Paramuricea clavata TaxID=317549 RepID=A0A6S7FM38_PARCT|nr:SHKBP1 isoform 5 [Paramuricea clavata]